MFEAFARLVRRVSSSTLCSEGPSRQFSQSADAWTSFYEWSPKRRYFSSSKMRIPARNMANPRASSKPPARDADTRERELNFVHRFGAKTPRPCCRRHASRNSAPAMAANRQADGGVVLAAAGCETRPGFVNLTASSERSPRKRGSQRSPVSALVAGKAAWAGVTR